MRILKKLFILSGLLTATYFLGLTLFFLPHMTKNLSFELVDILIVTSMFFEIYGCISLLLSWLPIL